MSQLVLSGLYFYPVKSFAGIALEQAPLDARGIRHDRHWMLVGPDGRFITQRQQPRMCLVQVSLKPSGLRLAAPDMPDLDLPLDNPGGEQLEVEIWGEWHLANSMGTRAASWISQFLGTECRLVYLPQDRQRQVDPEYARVDDQVGFADGFPLLLISQGSLDGLNQRLEQPVPMIRFRPNLVVSGCEPHAEDEWKRIRIGALEFEVAKPCSRCVIPSIDPQTAEKGVEPLRSLIEYRRWDNQVWFGQNLLHRGQGILKLGMPVEVLE